MADTPARSPLAPARFPEMPVIPGVRFSVAEAGIKYRGRNDVMLAVLTPGSTVAGVFTRSSTRSAPVLDCQAKIGKTGAGAAAVLVNSGNANAFTGHYGQTSVAELVAATSAATGVPPDRVFTSSTGVIGEPLPHDRIVSVLDQLVETLDEGGIADAADAIRTTDTFAKGATRQIMVDGHRVTVAGIAKGSGMIAPDMATMLVYIFTDAKIDQPALQTMLSEINARTFNCITVDSDTSTSDSLLLCATGQSGADCANSPSFRSTLADLMTELAHLVVKDGEGATKFVTISVSGAVDDHEAKTHALSIANSPLVKTAIAGEDPNWGRIVMAIGKSGATADRDKLSIWFDDVAVAENGWVCPEYREEDGAAVMAGQEIHIRVGLGLGSGNATVWTCDLTHGYITINADYRS